MPQSDRIRWLGAECLSFTVASAQRGPSHSLLESSGLQKPPVAYSEMSPRASLNIVYLKGAKFEGTWGITRLSEILPLGYL